MTSLNCFRRPSGNNRTTLEKGGKNPPDVTLDHVAKDLLSFFNGFKCLHKVKKEIEKKYDVKNEHGHYCWPDDDIKRAWGKTQRMDMKSSRRKDWARVIMLQVIKTFICDECKQNAAQEESSVALENQSSTDEDSFHTEVNSDVNSNDSETSDSESVNENEDDSVNNCEQQTLHEKFELSVDVHDEENVSCENVLRSRNINLVHGRASIMKENAKDKRRIDPIDDVNKPSLGYKRKRTDGSKKGIRIPFMKMCESNSQLPCENDVPTYKLIDGSPLKIKTNTKESTEIEIRKRKSYVMSFDKDKNNATWVYEILNTNLISTLASYKKQNFIKDKEYKSEPSRPDSGNEKMTYERGHLAAAANHKWCQEAYKDTFYLSNMTPQVKILNKGLWKMLENKCRKKAVKDSVSNVHVYTGPLYLNGSSEYKVVFHKVVPTHYFKVIIVEKKNGTVEEPECYLMPNDESKYLKKSNLTENEKKEELKKYKKNIQEIEKESKLEFTENYSKLEDYTGQATFKANNENKTVTIDVRISI